MGCLATHWPAPTSTLHKANRYELATVLPAAVLGRTVEHCVASKHGHSHHMMELNYFIHTYVCMSDGGG